MNEIEPSDAFIKLEAMKKCLENAKEIVEVFAKKYRAEIERYKKDNEKLRRFKEEHDEKRLKKLKKVARNLFFNMKWKKAVEYFDKILEADEFDGYIWINKGFALRIVGKYKEAVACYDKAILIDPEYKVALYNKGVALDGLRKYKEAVECHDKALEIDPYNRSAKDRREKSLQELKRIENDEENELPTLADIFKSFK